MSGLLFVLASMLAMGSALTVPMIMASVSNVRLVVLALIANFVIVPAIAYGASQLLISDDHGGLQTGLILVGAAAGAPFLPKLVQTAKGSVALGVGLMVVLMLVTVVYLPIVLPRLLPGDMAVDSWQIARSLILLMLVPLGIGLFVRARYEVLATSLGPLASQVSSLAIAVLMVTLIVLNFEQIIDTVGTGGIGAALILLSGAFGVGYVFGGNRDERSVLGLATAQRNMSAAIVVAAQNFANDPEVITMVMVVGVLGLVILFAAAAELGRRAWTMDSQPRRSDPDSVTTSPAE